MASAIRCVFSLALWSCDRSSSFGEMSKLRRSVSNLDYFCMYEFLEGAASKKAFHSDIPTLERVIHASRGCDTRRCWSVCGTDNQNVLK